MHLIRLKIAYNLTSEKSGIKQLLHPLLYWKESVVQSLYTVFKHVCNLDQSSFRFLTLVKNIYLLGLNDGAGLESELESEAMVIKRGLYSKQLGRELWHENIPILIPSIWKLLQTKLDQVSSDPMKRVSVVF